MHCREISPYRISQTSLMDPQLSLKKHWRVGVSTLARHGSPSEYLKDLGTTRTRENRSSEK